MDRYRRDRLQMPAGEVLTEDERQVIGAIVRAGRARSALRAGHPQPGGAAGAHGRLASVEAATVAGQRSALACLGAAAADGARDASGARALEPSGRSHE